MKGTSEINDANIRPARAEPTDTGPSQSGPPASHEMIARRAYEIWQRHGCPSGTAFHDWLAAKAELRSARRYWPARARARKTARQLIRSAEAKKEP